ncbi:MAG: hypothetical protein A4E53_01541 [Pelotomaculum sp. PtaB.Bin104]|nr:MAG: hypothetical protein A4E53_01541 [Pelotomaculum sp. PtaB.Bin104]
MEKLIGYEKLKTAVERDCNNGRGCFNSNGCDNAGNKTGGKISKNNVVPFTRTPKEDMLPLQEWEYSDFKLLFDQLRETYNEDEAWKTIHRIWQIRAGEIEN